MTACCTALALFACLGPAASARPRPGRRTVSVTYDFGPLRLFAAGDRCRVAVAGCPKRSRVGEPLIPFRAAHILLPPGAKVVRVRARELEAGETVQAPMPLDFGRPAIPFGPEPQRLRALELARNTKPDAKIFGSNTPYPETRAEFLSVQELCGRRIALVRVFPVQYVPAKGQLIGCRRIRIDVDVTQPALAALATRLSRGDRKGTARVAAFVDNPEAAAAYESIPQDGGVLLPWAGGRALKEAAQDPSADATSEEGGKFPQGPGTPYHYLLITSTDLMDDFAPLVTHKTSLGLAVATETTENIYATYTGVDNPEKIRNCIKDYYANSGIQYVLLGGDTSVVPYRGAYGYASTVEELNLPTDLYYSCLDGSWNANGDKYWGTPVDAEPGYADIDLLGEVYVGRAPVDTAEEATRFVNKVKGYELSGNPNVGKCLFLGEYLGNGAQGGDALDTIAPYFAGRTVEWLDDRPHTSAQWTNTACIAELNESPHIVAHVGHGNATTVMRLSREDVDLLTNTHLWLVNSMACYSGAFDSSDCIAEDLSKRNSSAAFAAIMNTRYGWYKDSDPSKYSVEFQQKFFDCLLSQGVAKIGAALQQSKHDMVGEVENSGSMTYRWCYFTITLFGDPHTELASAGDPALTVRSFDDSAGVDDYFGGVTIDVDPDPDADTPFTRSYAQGTALTLTAPATHGELTFSHWKLDGADQTAGVAELSVTMGTDHTAVAVYEAQTLPLLIDMAVFEEGTADLNPTGPAPASLTILSIDMPGATETTEIAMTVGGGQWLRFVTDPSSNVDVYTDGGAAEWHTPAEWASKRIRGLTPGATYDFQAKTRDGPGEPESELSDVGSYATNAACDVDRSGAVDQTDLDYARDAILSAAGIGTSGKPWATDVNGDRETHVLDIILIRGDIPGD